ncbi:MAG: hypothetical protein WBG37_08420 [Desulfobacterales bacterium]
METFAPARVPVANPLFPVQKRESLAGLISGMLDAPLVEMINALNALSYCFTLQSCYGHFLYPGQKEAHNLDPLPHTRSMATVEYRIAYLAFCVEWGAPGERLLGHMSQIAARDPNHIQFGSPGWFWALQVNSYALQVEPLRFKDQDRVVLDYGEALHVEHVRNRVFNQLNELLQKL